MNSSKVRITKHAETGEVVNPTKNPEFSYIRVEQTVTSMENGFFNERNRSAIITGPTEKLQAANFKAGQTLPGKIVVRETLQPQYDGQEPKINPETGEALTQGGNEIYRQSVYTEDLSQHDQLLSHDTVEESAAVKAEQKAEMSIS